MKDSISCMKCEKSFGVDIDEYYTYEEGEVCGIFKCPFCRYENGVSYYTITSFTSCAFDEKDKERFDIEDGRI